jgi:hypothetical protein
VGFCANLLKVPEEDQGALKLLIWLFLLYTEAGAGGGGVAPNTMLLSQEKIWDLDLMIIDARFAGLTVC